MGRSRRENIQLQSDYTRLQDSYRELEALKEKLEQGQVASKLNLTDAQKDTDNTKCEVSAGNWHSAHNGPDRHISMHILQLGRIIG